MDETYQKRQHPKVQQSIRDAVSLNNAVNFYSGDDPLGVLGVAEVFRNWLNTVSQEEPVKTESTAYPTPTLEQKKVLDEIVKRSGKPMSIVYPTVLDWVKKTYDADQYPQLLSSVSQFLEWSGWS